jgi:hypothetical protein
MALRIFLNNNFHNYTHLLHLLWNDDILKLYNNIQVQNYSLSPKSFIGKHACGESCLILKYILEKNNFKNIKVYRNSYRDEYGLHDHVFLHYNNQIIDPTHRQFFLDNRIKNYNCMFKDQLFNILNPILLIDDNNIEKYVQNLININKYTYGSAFAEAEDININWKFQEDVTHKFIMSDQKNKKNMKHFMNYISDK